MGELAGFAELGDVTLGGLGGEVEHTGNGEIGRTVEGRRKGFEEALTGGGGELFSAFER